MQLPPTQACFLRGNSEHRFKNSETAESETGPRVAAALESRSEGPAAGGNSPVWAMEPSDLRPEGPDPTVRATLVEECEKTSLNTY